MVTAGIAVAAAAVTLAVALMVAQVRRGRSERRSEAVLERVDQHMRAISSTLERIVDRSTEARARGVGGFELVVDLDELLRRIAAEAAARTDAHAAVVHVQGVGETPTVATFGAAEGVELVEAPLGTGAGPFRAVTINWTYRPTFEQDADALTSALVVPIVEGGVATGAIAAYTRASAAFDAEHVGALEALAEEAAPAIVSARSFQAAERAMADAATGVRNKKGYESELERAVMRAHTTGLPLSLLLLELAAPRKGGQPAEQPPSDLAARELATLLQEASRSNDVVCRQRDDAFGIVLPDTTGDAARRFYLRLKEKASRASFAHARQLTFAAGFVEWRPDETSTSFDARASAAVGHSRVDALELGSPETEPPRPASPSTSPPQDLVERLALEISRAQDMTRPLAVLMLDIDGLGSDDERLGRSAVRRALEDIEARVGSSLHNGDSSSRIGDRGLAVVLPGSDAAGAERLFAALQASLESQPPDEIARLAVSAGITELATGDDPDTVLGRAKHALWQARQAGDGTVVVAMAGDDTRH